MIYNYYHKVQIINIKLYKRNFQKGEFMQEFLLILSTIITIVIVGYFVLNRYNSIFIFISSGLMIFFIITLVTGTSVLGDKSTGNIFLDIVELLNIIWKKNAGGIAVILMSVTAYAAYMSHIKAANLLADQATRVLVHLKNPYLVMSGILLLGFGLKLMITSHSGLSILMMATAFPILIRLGISRLSAAAIMVAVGSLDWGPNDGSVIFGADVAQMGVTEYVSQYQMPVALCVIGLLTVFYGFYFKYLDSKNKGVNDTVEEMETEDLSGIPCWYSLLPVIPLALVVAFAFIPTINMNVISANIIGFIIVFTVEIFRIKNLKEVSCSMTVALGAMGVCFANIVSIIIAAGFFAESIKAIGGISLIASFLATMDAPIIIVVTFMSLITFGASILMGSGNASWVAFGPLVPDVVKILGTSVMLFSVPMQIAASLGRTISPVAGALIAVAGMAKVDITDLVKQNIVPMIFGFIVNVILSIILI